jgi:flavin-dependent dehydrogenase
LVAGGCTAGLYFGGLMARAGYRVLICDKSAEKDLGNRFDVIHIGGGEFGRFGFHKPGPGDPEYVRTFTHGFWMSALDRYPKKKVSEIVVCRRVPLLARLAAWAREGGAELAFDTVCEKPLVEGGAVAGAVFSQKGQPLTVKARLTADATGIGAVLRTALPPEVGVETFVTGPEDQFYVILHYVTLKDPAGDKVDMNTSWLYYKTWIAPREQPGGAIIGVGANLSFEYARFCYERFASRIALPGHRLDYTEESSSPYRRPPYSFVGNGFIVLGDAACITNPWSGEGVPYGWLLCRIGAEEASAALKTPGIASRDALWQTNVRYAQEQGADFASNLAMLSGAVNCSPEENDYEFRKSIIFQADGEKPGSLPLQLLGALVSGGISARSLGKLLGAASIGGKIKKHYLAFPRDPANYEAWVKGADALWAKAPNMAEMAEEDLASMKGGS